VRRQRSSSSSRRRRARAREARDAAARQAALPQVGSWENPGKIVWGKIMIIFHLSMGYSWIFMVHISLMNL